MEGLLFKLISPSLKMLSFGALPPLKVNLTDSYNRVSPGAYDLLQCFELPSASGSGTVEVAMMLRAPGWQVNGERPLRLDVQFSTVSMLPGASAEPDEAMAAMEAAGLGEAARAPVEIEAKATYIDVEALSEALRVHKGASGKTYILQRVDAIPYVVP